MSKRTIRPLAAPAWALALLAMSGCVGSSSGTSGAEAPAEVADERLFSSASPWNTPATGSPDPTSALRISSDSVGSLKHAFKVAGKGFDIAGTTAYPDYGVPLYTADASTRRVRVGDTYGWWGGFSSVPLPEQATPAVGSDHHLAVWDVPQHTLYEFWELRKNEAGEWMAGAGARFDTHGMGYQTEAGALSARAYGGSLIAGSILHKEMKAGVIPHALAMAYPWTGGHHYARGLGTDGVTVNIASHSDNVDDPERNGPACIPEGARLRLKSSVDVNRACGANTACRIIGTALKTYGAYVVDRAGVATFYAEVLTGKDESWTGLLTATDARAFTADDFELLSLPATLTPSR
ncbi:hypothetical protein JQX13_10285 [Archangium violaceum]|uniref:hypothetical protein n=1 Tax=Archangium violaceum TaxID=83451 RepID=UPI00193B6662|nr:hypothetical protein [Archangium violaceum]QRK10438.1 hypothetical protein JQX13_10285 [Archangium violaceum]